MRNVQKIIDTFGGIAALKSRPIRLEVAGFMRLVVEYIGRGPRGCDMVSIAHYGEQNGDLMRDPEIVFEVAAGQWQPVSIQEDCFGSYRADRRSGGGRGVAAGPAARGETARRTTWDLLMAQLAQQGLG